MASLKTSEESAAAALTGTEQVRIVQSAANVRTTTADISLSVKDTDVTLAGNSDARYATQKAVKAYVDALLAAANAVVYKGATDCSANPNYPAASAGDLYIVSVSGKIGGASGIDVIAGDMFICKTDSTASGNQATVGAQWNVIHTAGAGGGSVTSVDASGGLQTTTGSAITSTGTIRGAHVVNAQTGTSYAVVAADRGKRVTLSNAASIAATIAQAGGTGFEDGYFTYLENIGVGSVTLTPTTSTVNGAATLVLNSGMKCVLFSDGTNYRAFVIEAAGHVINAQTGTTYTYLSGDRSKLVSHSNAAAIAGTLPQATGAFGSSWYMFVQNRGAGTLTITPTTSTIDGAASLALTTGQGILVASDGTNYFTMRGLGSGGGGALSNFTESVNTSAPNATVPVVQLLATNAASVVDVALTPKGAGALSAHVADSTSTGGNKRGANSVDWQTTRSTAARAATGANSVIGGGEHNTASSNSSTVGGGSTNTASGNKSTVPGGDTNTASGSNSTVGGGVSNTASTNGGVIAGGGANIASGGNYPSIGGGSGNTASGSYSTVPGGIDNLASGDYSIAWGREATTRGLKAMYAWSSSGLFSTKGTAQYGRYNFKNRTSDATATVLDTDGGTPNSTTSLVLPNDSVYTFTMHVSAHHQGNTAGAGFIIHGCVRRGANAASIVLVGTAVTQTFNETGSTAWTAVVGVDTTLGSLKLTVTGEAAKTIRWNVIVHTSEVADA